MGEVDALREKDLGNAAYKKKDWTAAHEHYDRAIALDAKNIVYHTNKAGGNLRFPVNSRFQPSTSRRANWTSASTRAWRRSTSAASTAPTTR